MPHEKWGETPCCFYELKPGCKAPTEEELKVHCKQHLSRFMCPARFIQEALPKTASGKIQKFVLRAKAKELTSAESVLQGVSAETLQRMKVGA